MQGYTFCARKIDINQIGFTILVSLFSVPLFAIDNNNAEINMSDLEQFYQGQLLLEGQGQSNQQQSKPQNIEPTQHVVHAQEDLRARRLREWQEVQYQVKQPVRLQPSNNHVSPAPPEADDLFAAAINGNTAQIGALLAQGLDVNTSNNERETALHMAAARGHYSTVIYLINHGAYFNARTVKNWIPLHHAVRFRHPNIVNFLVKRGSSPGARTSDGLSAIDIAKGVNDYRLLSILGAR